MNTPIHMSRTPPRGQSPPPALGEHTDEVLRELLELNESEIQSLRELHVI